MQTGKLKPLGYLLGDIFVGVLMSLVLSGVVYALFRTIYGPTPPDEVDWVMESIVTAIVLYGLNYMFFNGRRRNEKKADEQRQLKLEADLAAIKQQLGITE